MSEIDNRKRCLKCKYYSCNCCPLMMGADVFKIDNCILNYSYIKSLDEDSPDMYLLTHYPKVFFELNNYKMMKNGFTPKVGDKVFTLINGFSSRYPGVILTISSKDNFQYFLDYEDHDGQACVELSDWIPKIVVIEK